MEVVNINIRLFAISNLEHLSVNLSWKFFAKFVLLFIEDVVGAVKLLFVEGKVVVGDARGDVRRRGVLFHLLRNFNG